MLDIKLLRQNFQAVKEKLSARGEDLSDLEQFEAVDEKRRELIAKTEELKAKRNQVSKEIATLKREKQDADAVIKEMRVVSDEIKTIDDELRGLDEKLTNIMLSIPNIPHESTPIGETEDDNVEDRKWGEVTTPNFEQTPHWEIGEKLGLLDFERAAKTTGRRFVFYTGLGARLERALLNFVMDLHSDQHGYQEMLAPYLVKRARMTRTVELAKFAEDVFKIDDWVYLLDQSAEEPVTTFYADDVLSMDDLAKKDVAYSASFRSEAV